MITNIKKFGKFIFNLGKCSIKEDFSGMASEMAFSFILAFFPFMIFLVSIFGVAGTEDQVNQIILYISAFVPASVMEVVQNTLQNVIDSSSGSLLTVGFLAAMLVASNAMAIMIKGLNRAHNVEETRPIWYTRGLSIVMLFINALVMFIGVNSIIFGKLILSLILNYIHISPEYVNTVLFIRWPIVFMALFTMAFLNYYFMPNILGTKNARLYSTIPGSLFFCLFWLFASWAFGVYVNNFGMYNKVYGTIGVFAVLLLWMYYTSLIILIGGEINSQFYKRLTGEKKSLSDEFRPDWN